MSGLNPGNLIWQICAEHGTRDQKIRTVSTCWINPGGLSLKEPCPFHEIGIWPGEVAIANRSAIANSLQVEVVNLPRVVTFQNIVRARQRSREGVVRRIRRPKFDFGQSILFSVLYSLEALESRVGDDNYSVILISGWLMVEWVSWSQLLVSIAFKRRTVASLSHLFRAA